MAKQFSVSLAVLCQQSVSVPIVLTQSTCDEVVSQDATPEILIQKTQAKYSPKKSVYMRTGYMITTKIATTLQGSVYNAVDKNGKKVVLKRASMGLHSVGVATVEEKVYNVKENIQTEASILKYLETKNPPKSLIKYMEFFNDGRNYFLLLENGGESLYEYTSKMHKLQCTQVISIKNWCNHIKIIFRQMVQFIHWLHYRCLFTHLDISLENILIGGYCIRDGNWIKHGQIKFIDFGLAKSFVGEKDFNNCTKYVGKKTYQCPKIYSKKPYNAAKADIWSLGVVLFIMTFGVVPYNAPDSSDALYKNVIGNIKKWSKLANKQQYLSKHLLTTLNRMLCDERRRITTKEMFKLKYLK